MAKITLKVMVKDLHFQYQLRVSWGAYLVQIWWFQPKFVMSYHADKVKFMDGRTELMDMQARTIPLGLKGQGVKRYKIFTHISKK